MTLMVFAVVLDIGYCSPFPVMVVLLVVMGWCWCLWRLQDFDVKFDVLSVLAPGGCGVLGDVGDTGRR